jgi:arsenate reductase
MKKYIYLSTCDTCKRILKELQLPADVEMQDIKKNPVTEEQVAFLYGKTGSYEALINKRSRKFKESGIVAKECTEEQFKGLLFKDYTFLARPVLIWEDEAFIGNAKKTVEAAKALVSE